MPTNRTNTARHDFEVCANAWIDAMKCGVNVQSCERDVCSFAGDGSLPYAWQAIADALYDLREKVSKVESLLRDQPADVRRVLLAAIDGFESTERQRIASDCAILMINAEAAHAA